MTRAARCSHGKLLYSAILRKDPEISRFLNLEYSPRHFTTTRNHKSRNSRATGRSRVKSPSSDNGTTSSTDSNTQRGVEVSGESSGKRDHRQELESILHRERRKRQGELVDTVEQVAPWAKYVGTRLLQTDAENKTPSGLQVGRASNVSKALANEESEPQGSWGDLQPQALGKMAVSRHNNSPRTVKRKPSELLGPVTIRNFLPTAAADLMTANSITRSEFLQNSSKPKARHHISQADRNTKHEIVHRALQMAQEVVAEDSKQKENAAYRMESKVHPNTGLKITRYSTDDYNEVATKWQNFYNQKRASAEELNLEYMSQYFGPNSTSKQDPFLAGKNDQLDSETANPVGIERTSAKLEDDHIPEDPRHADVTTTLDLLRDLGAQLQNSATPESEQNDGGESPTNPGSSPISDSTWATLRAESRGGIDWDALPLSPLMHQRLIDARNKYRLKKPSPKRSPVYDKERAEKVSDDYLAKMIATPIRYCRLSNARLPTAFMLTMQPKWDTSAEELWEDPLIKMPPGLRSDGEPVLEANIRERFVRESQAGNEQHESVQVSTSTNDNRGLLTRKGSTDSVPAQKSDGEAALSMQDDPDTDAGQVENHVMSDSDSSTQVRATVKITSYVLSTYAVIQTLSNFPDRVYQRLLPLNWRKKLGTNLFAKVRRREDTAGLVLSLMQQQVLGYLKPLRSFAGHGLVGVSMNTPGYYKKEFRLPVMYHGSVLLYFGPTKSSIDAEPSFSQAVNTFVGDAKRRLELFDDLFENRDPAQPTSHAVRLVNKNGGNMIVYDMTRMLTQDHIQTLRVQGWEELMYYIGTFRSHAVRQALYRLAHYRGSSQDVSAQQNF